MRRLSPILAAWVVLTLAPVAHGGGVSLLGGFFDPATIQVAPGEKVTFTNDDSIAHTVTSSWDDGRSIDVILAPGESVTQVFPGDGVFSIHCRPHTGMEMHVAVAAVQTATVVEDPSSNSPGALLPLMLAGVAAACLMLIPPRPRARA